MAAIMQIFEHFLGNAYNFLCNPLSPRRRVTTRIWTASLIIFTASTTAFMLGCVCSDNWEITTYDINTINETIYNKSINNDQCTYTTTKLKSSGLLIITSSQRRANSLITSSQMDNQSIVHTDSVDQGACQGRSEYQNISLAFTQTGNAFWLCLEASVEVWDYVERLCSPSDIQKCLYYTPASVKRPFCCKRCLYDEYEVQELDDNGDTTFEPIFTVIGFLIVCLIVLCVCHLLAIIALWKRLVPVVMFTGILFLVSGTFMAFCLAAHRYKIYIMNWKGRILPHMTSEMAVNGKTVTGWSVDAGWMGFVFSIICGILWIRFSFHLASETTYNKIYPTMAVIHGNGGSLNRTTSVVTNNASIARPTSPDPQLMVNGNAGAGLIPKTVRWAVSAGKETNSTAPSSRAGSGNQLLQNGANGTVQNSHIDHAHSPMMVEDAV